MRCSHGSGANLATAAMRSLDLRSLSARLPGPRPLTRELPDIRGATARGGPSAVAADVFALTPAASSAPLAPEAGGRSDATLERKELPSLPLAAGKMYALSVGARPLPPEPRRLPMRWAELCHTREAVIEQMLNLSLRLQVTSPALASPPAPRPPPLASPRLLGSD